MKRGKLDDAPKGKLTVIRDFLPAPSQLLRKSETVKVTSEFTQPVRFVQGRMRAEGKKPRS
jgi:hypothetical protein